MAWGQAARESLGVRPIAAPAPVTRPEGWGLDAGPVSLLQMWRPGIHRRHDGAIDQKTKESIKACITFNGHNSRPSAIPWT